LLAIIEDLSVSNQYRDSRQPGDFNLFSLGGDDLNRVWHEPSKALHSTVFETKLVRRGHRQFPHFC
jgi:hypothetical protein